MSTILDIAKRAGVSKSTASLALNGDARVRPATRRRVLEAARVLNYHPTRAARSLSSGRTWSLQLLNPVADHALSSGFFTRFMRGVHDVAQQHSYTVALSVLEDAHEALDVLKRLISEKWADGVILLNASRDEALLDRMIKAQFPHVLLGRSSYFETLSVDNDNERSAFEATTHLLKGGLAPVAFLNGPAHLAFTQDRAAGYQAALEQAGQRLRPDLLAFTDGSAEAARATVSQWLGRPSVPRSILAISDTVALGALRALQDRGLKVPEDIALVGMNNDDVAEYVTPRLTSVDLHAYELGCEAASLLLEHLKGQVAPGTRRLVPHHLVIRDSSA